MNQGKSSLSSTRRAVAVLAFVLATAAAWSGPVFAPGQKLFIIKTEHFDIIFSERSRPTALALASYAEEALEYVEGELSLTLPGRVPVAVTPDVGSFNGYSTPFPYAHIVLYDAPLDPSWTAFEETFRGLFIHELTHAVSLQSRAPWAQFLSGVFGSWISPALANAPEFMIEGVTVGLEGEGGVGGRAVDPLVKQRIRQDIRENKFKSPLECEGVYDDFPGGDVYYEYGGLFTAYLRERYGKESYALLWKSLGTMISPFSLDPYERGFFKAFEKAYGIGFEEAWADFRDAMAIQGVMPAPERVGPGKPQYLEGLAAGGGSLFWVDGIAGRALRLDAATGTTSSLFDADAATSITDASADGSRLVVLRRALALPDGRDRGETAVYDVAARRFVPGSSMPGLRAARFFRDGYVGIASRLHLTDLVLEREGERRVLLSGSDGVVFSSPAVLDDRRIALIVSVRAVRSVGVLDVDSGELSLLRPEPSAAGDDARVFDYARQLSASGGRLWFNHDSDDRMYKLGVVEGLDGETCSVRVVDEDWSGGVFWPTEVDGRVYYAGRFSAGYGLCRAPGPAEGGAAEGGAAGGARTIACRLERVDPAVLGEGRDRPIAVPATGMAAEAAAVPAAETAAAAAEPSIEPYRPLAYFNPFRFWIPYVDLAAIDRSFRPFGLFLMGDPIGSNTVTLDAGYDSTYPMADIALEWLNKDLPVVLDLAISDGLSYGASGPPERLSAASASATLSIPLYPSPRLISIGLGGEVFARAEGAAGSPYAWPYSEPGAVASAVAAWKGRMIGPWQNSGRGLDLTGFFDLETGAMIYKTEACLTASYDRPALRLDLWGAWADEPILNLDSSSEVFSSDRRPSYFEYADSGRGSSDYSIQGTASWRLADQPIRSGVLGLYLNRLLLDTGYRGAYFRGEYLHSCFARASLDVSSGLGAAGAVGVRLFVEAFARLDGSELGDAVGLRLGGTLRGDAGLGLRGGAAGDEP